MASVRRAFGAVTRPGLLRCAPIAHPQTSSYHSYDHPKTDPSRNTSEQAILSAAYTHIPTHGFSTAALALGAKDAGFPDISTSILPHGPFSLVEFHLVTKRKALAAQSRQIFTNTESSKVEDKVERLTWERLLANEAVVHRWQEALAIMAQPSYVSPSLKELALLTDEILFLAGDSSVDSSWYTKRGSLATIYASTELFMTTDSSAGFSSTREFLRRRLDESQGVGSILGAAGQWMGFTASAGINVLRSKGLRI